MNRRSRYVFYSGAARVRRDDGGSLAITECIETGVAIRCDEAVKRTMILSHDSLKTGGEPCCMRETVCAEL